MSQTDRHLESYPSTRWSQVLRGAGDDPESARAAWEDLARAYLPSIRAYLQRVLRQPSDTVEDQVQGFFAWMLETRFLRKSDPERGRFRALLKTALRHFVVDRTRSESARKRGGAAQTESIDSCMTDEVVDPEQETPDAALDRAWRSALVASALDDVEYQLTASGHQRAFAVFREYFLEGTSNVDYRSVAERNGLSIAQVSNELMRCKNLYREALRRRVIDSVRDEHGLGEELAWLFGRTTP